MEDNNINDSELFYDTDKAVEFIYSKLSATLKSRIDKEDIYEILDKEVDYMLEIGIIFDEDSDDNWDDDSDDDDFVPVPVGSGSGKTYIMPIPYDRDCSEVEVMLN